MTSSEALKNALSKPSCISISNTAKPIPPLERNRRGLFASKFRHASGTNPTNRRSRPRSDGALIQIDRRYPRAADCLSKAKPTPPPFLGWPQKQPRCASLTSLLEAKSPLGSQRTCPAQQRAPGKNQ